MVWHHLRNLIVSCLLETVISLLPIREDRSVEAKQTLEATPRPTLVASEAVELACTCFDSQGVHIRPVIVVRLWTQRAELDLNGVTPIIKFKTYLPQDALYLSRVWLMALTLMTVWSDSVAPLVAALLLRRAIPRRVALSSIGLFVLSELLELLRVVGHSSPHMSTVSLPVAALNI